MTWLVGAFAVGLALSLLPWKPVAIAVSVSILVWLGFWYFGPLNVWLPLALMLAPALLLGWACGLLIRRTIEERRAR